MTHEPATRRWTAGDAPPVLVVEDSPEDYEATRRAFARVEPRLPLRHCEDGEDALDYLYGRGRYSVAGCAPRPAMILLDLNLPRTDGQSVIGHIRSTPSLCTIPVIVLTTSADPRDVAACYAAGANSYVQKPVDFLCFVDAIASLQRFWLWTAVLP